MTTRPAPTRRGFLLLVGSGVAAAVTACSEPSARPVPSPRPPGPTSQRIPSETERALLPWYEETLAAAAHLRAAPAGVATRRWRAVLAGQQARLRAGLLAAGAPAASLPPAPVVRSASLARAAATMRRTATTDAVADALATPVPSRAALLVLVATRAAAAQNLAAGPLAFADSVPSSEAARALLPQLQAVRYVVQVAAAAASPKERTLWLTPLDQLSDLVSDLQAQLPDDAPPPLTMPLAGGVRTPAERTARIREAAEAWTVAYAGELARHVERPAEEVLPLVGGLSRAILGAVGLGAPLSPFPGLREA